MRWFVFVLGLSVVLLAGPVRAQNATATAAEALFRSGKLAMDRGEYDVACESFRESFRLQAAVGTLLNVGACEEKRGHFALALQCFRDSLALLGDGDYRRSYAEERLAASKERVASVRILVEGPRPAGLRLIQDGVELGAASVGVEFFVDPGEHVFAASAPGHEPQRTTASLTSGEHRSVVFRLQPARAPAPVDRAKEAPVPRPMGRGPGPYILLGTGATAAIAGSVFGLVVMNAASDVRDHCDATGCDETGLSAADRGRPFAVLSPIFLGTGAAMIGAGAFWFVLSGGAKVRPSISAVASGVTLEGTL